MTQTSYCIACKDRSGGQPLWLGCVEDGAGAYWCDVEAGLPQPGTPEFWLLTPIPGTDAYYLLNQTVNLYACFATGSDLVALRPLDIFDPGFIVRLDDTGDGWVAVNNAARDNVFTARDQPVSGTPVVQYPWKGGDNQLWKFVDANMVLTIGAAIAG